MSDLDSQKNLEKDYENEEIKIKENYEKNLEDCKEESQNPEKKESFLVTKISSISSGIKGEEIFLEELDENKEYFFKAKIGGKGGVFISPNRRLDIKGIKNEINYFEKLGGGNKYFVSERG